MAKLFLGGTPPGTTEEHVRAAFQHFGEIVDIVCMKERGFGFITFKDQAAADAVLSEGRGHSCAGAVITVKPASAKGKGKGDGAPQGLVPTSDGGVTGPPTCKIFIGGLPQDCPDEKVREYFEKYGDIVDCVVMKDRMTGRTRGFGFVEYSDTEAVEKVMADFKEHKIDDKWVEVKRSIPKDQMDTQSIGDPRRSYGGSGGYAVGLGGGGGAYGGGGYGGGYGGGGCGGYGGGGCDAGGYRGGYGAGYHGSASQGYGGAQAYGAAYGGGYGAGGPPGAYGAYSPAAAYGGYGGATGGGPSGPFQLPARRATPY